MKLPDVPLVPGTQTLVRTWLAGPVPQVKLQLDQPVQQLHADAAKAPANKDFIK